MANLLTFGEKTKFCNDPPRKEFRGCSRMQVRRTSEQSVERNPSRYLWFWLGFMVAQTLNIIVVTGPDKAEANLRELVAKVWK